MRRFVSCAADNGIDIFRLHDPLNDVSNLLEAGEAILAAGKEFHVGLVYSAGREGEIDALVERAKQLPALGATRVILNDPTDALLPHLTEELVQRIGEETGLPVGLFVQGAAGTGLLNAVVATRVGADLIATAIYPLALTLHRVSGESLVDALHGLGRETGVDTAPLWEACDLVDEHIGDQPVAPVAPRIAVRAAEYDLPAGLVAALDVHLRAHAAGDRLLDTLTEVVRIRAESGWPPLASPIGQILASQALLNVLSARRYGTVLDEFRMLVEGAYGTTPAPIEESVTRAVALVTGSGGGLDEDPPSAEDVREAAEGLAASEEDLVLLAMFGQEAETLLHSIRQRHSRETSLLLGDVDATRAERIRELVKIVQESGVGEIEIEDEGMRVSVRRADEVGAVAAPLAAIPEGADADLPGPGRGDDAGRVADGGRLLPVVVAREPRVRRGRRRRQRRPDAVPARGDEALQRAQGRAGGPGQGDPRRERPARRVRPAALRARAGRHPADRLSVFSRVLVANRGEIAVRVIRALHELGVEAVAVYSTAEREALHVRMADQAVCIGPPSAHGQLPADSQRRRRRGDDGLRGRPSGLRLPLREPRLRARLHGERPRLHRAAGRGDGEDRRQGAREGRDARRRRAARARHRRRCEPRRDQDRRRRARLPGAAQGHVRWRRQGHARRQLARGSRGRLRRRERGGRGVVRRRIPLPRARARPRPARRDPGALRHGQGGVLTLGERECSIQRRHQKLVEESPSLALTPETREAMEASVERACRQLGYVNAGTFEFLLGPDGAPSFIEVNCRLQVEHPVTEMTTGIDIVREQLRIAAGEPLTVTGRAPRSGHAIEVRINAEDPRRDFAPAAGNDHEVPATARPRCARRHGRDRGRRDPAVLRLDDREGDRPRRHPRCRDRPRDPRARGARGRGHPDDARRGARHPPLAGVPGRRLLDQLPCRDGRPPAIDAAGGRVTVAKVGRRQSRRTALFLLYQWDLTGQPMASLYDGTPDDFALQLAEAIAERAPALDERITAASDAWSADRLGTLERNVLRIGVYELEEGTVPAEVAINEAVVLAEAVRDGRRRTPRQRHPRPDRPRGGSVSANESLGRAQELAERLRAKLDGLERLAEAGDVDAAVDDLAEIAELAKQIEAEVQRARASADAGA